MSTSSPRSLKAILGEPAGSREEIDVLDEFLANRPEIGDRLFADLQGTKLVALYGLSHMARKFMFLRLGLGTGYPQTLRQAACTLSLTEDEALTIEDEALLKLEEVLDANRLMRLQDLLPAKEVAELKPDPSDESEDSPAEEPEEEEETEKPKKMKAPQNALCDKELEKLLKRMPAFEAYVLRKRLGISSKPMTTDQIEQELGNRPETVRILYLRGIKRLSEFLTPEAIRTLEARMLQEKPPPAEPAQVLALAEVQDAISTSISASTEPAPLPETEVELEPTQGAVEILPAAAPTEEQRADQPETTSQESEVVMKEVDYVTVSGRELEDAMRNVLEGLPPRSAQVLRMRLGLGADGLIQPMTVTEIAKTLGKSKQAIFSAYTPARSKMRELLGFDNTLKLEARMPKDGTSTNKAEAIAPVIPLPKRAKPIKRPRVIKVKPPTPKTKPAKETAFRRSIRITKQISQAIAKLPERLRWVADLRSDGMTLTEVAESLRISYGAAASASSQATIKLKKSLSDTAYQAFLRSLKKSKHGERRAHRQQMEQAASAHQPEAESEPTSSETTEPVAPPPSAKPAAPEQPAPTEDVYRIRATLDIPKALVRELVAIITGQRGRG